MRYPAYSTMCRLAAPIAAAALVVSCTDQTAPTDAAPPTGLSALNGPASPGHSGIFRFQAEFFTIAVDSKNRLISFTGLESSIADFCAGLGQFNIMDFQLKPHDAGQINSHIVDRVASIQVVAEPPDLTDDLCAGIRSAPVLYRGTANFKRTDNLFGDPATVGRAASVGWTSEGVLTDVVSGGQVHYNEEVRLRIDTNDVFKEDVSRIHVN